ncbi:MotA/TolQ/ExbB proton channel family protein [Pontiellaceae bacterium B1224]|nr:MotA/TolQ/ExbB proton channel family protein [Pontiellaceae bacterium B1224]
MKRLFLFFALLAGAQAQSTNSIDTDLRMALQQLSEQRERIAEEKPALARETSRIASELSTKRQTVQLLHLDRQDHQAEQAALSERIRELEAEFNAIDNLIMDYRKQFEVLLPVSELESFRPMLLAADQSLQARLDFLSRSIQHLETGFALYAAPGEALNASGTLLDGTFLRAGPVEWFISKDWKQGGLTVENRNLLPEIVEGTADLQALQKLLKRQSGAPRFDPTLGSAIALDQAKGSIIDHVRKGGFWVYPILALALIASLAAIGKWMQLSRIRDLRPGTMRTVLDAVKNEDRLKAETALAPLRHPAKALLQRGIELSNRPASEVEEAMYEKFLEAEPPLQRGLSFIAIASATAPLLGLLGTVTGMIYTFRLINVFGTGDAKSLASGISEALVTTELGLVVAIPALILHAFLSRRVQSIRSAMELASLAFVNGLPKKEDRP